MTQQESRPRRGNPEAAQTSGVGAAVEDHHTRRPRRTSWTTTCPVCAGTGVVGRHPGELRQQRALAHLAAMAMPWLADIGGES